MPPLANKYAFFLDIDAAGVPGHIVWIEFDSQDARDKEVIECINEQIVCAYIYEGVKRYV